MLNKTDKIKSVRGSIGKFCSRIIAICVLLLFSSGVGYADEITLDDSILITNNELNSNIELKDNSITTKIQGSVVEEQIPVQKTKLDIYIKQDQAEKNWIKLKESLKEKGIDFNTKYMGDNSLAISRGKNKDSSPYYNGFVKSNIDFDTQKLGLWNNGKARLTLPHKFGKGLPADCISSGISYSNLHVRRFFSMGEFWYEHSLLSDALKIKVGKQDLETDYAVLQDSFNYVNGGLSENPTIKLPAITNTAIGISTTITPNKNFKLRAGVFDGNAKRERLGFGTLFSGRYFDIIEGEINHNIKNHPGYTKIGYWYLDKDVNEISTSPTPRRFQSNYGLYSATRQMLIKENNDANDNQGLYAQSLYGWSPSDRNELPQFYGVGLQYKGPFNNRNDDVIGIGSDLATLNRKSLPNNIRSHEVFIESFYRIKISPFLFIQPDLQVVFKPYGTGKTTWILGLRTFITI